MAGLLARNTVPSSQKLLSVAPRVYCLSSRTTHGFWDSDKKSGYRKNDPRPKATTMIKDGLKEFKRETKLLSEEVIHTLTTPPLLKVDHGDYEYIWKMNSREDVELWTVTSDSDNNEGKSKASLVLSKNNTGIFHGYLSQDIPKDGIQKFSGYANIRAPSCFRAFKRKISYDWSLFNCLVMRVRGDGRPYMINIPLNNHFDVNWNDQYNYTLFTRGGPYWQIAKIPFSKFYMSMKGRIQDRQEPIHLDNVSTMGLTVGDGVEGPFSLEIDYIAVMFDKTNDETFAYESYACNPAYAGT